MSNYHYQIIQSVNIHYCLQTDFWFNVDLLYSCTLLVHSLSAELVWLNCLLDCNLKHYKNVLPLELWYSIVVADRNDIMMAKTLKIKAKF